MLDQKYISGISDVVKIEGVAPIEHESGIMITIRYWQEQRRRPLKR